MGDHDEPAAVRLEVVAQPDDRVRVEVVRRLVEEQRLDPGEQDARELDAAALTTGQRAQRLAEHAVVEAEVARDAVRLALGGVPAGGEEARLELGVALHGGLVRLDVGARHRALGLAHLAHAPVEAARREHAVHRDDVEVARARVLRQVADVVAARDLPRRRLGLPRERLGQGRLAGAVAPDEADPVAGGDLEGGLVQEHAGADAQLDAVSGDHGRVLSGGAGARRRPSPGRSAGGSSWGRVRAPRRPGLVDSTGARRRVPPHSAGGTCGAAARHRDRARTAVGHPHQDAWRAARR